MANKNPTKLRDPDIHKVDLVDDGANPGAKIMLFKRAPSKSDDKSGKGGEDTEGIIKTLISRIGKALGWESEQIQKAMDLAKEDKSTAVTFDQKLFEQSRRKITSEIWDYCYALEEALCSIMQDQTLNANSRVDMMIESLDKFATTMETAIPIWCGGETAEEANEPEEVAKSGKKISAARMDRLKACRDTLDELIKDAETVTGDEANGGNPEGEPDGTAKGNFKKNNNQEDGKMPAQIDKSKLSPEVLEYVNSLEKRATDAETEAQTAKTDLQKMKDAHPDPEDVYKGLHPTVRKELEDLKKAKEESEKKEFVAKAAGYSALGVKPDEFGPVLKKFATADPEGFQKLDEVLKSANELVKNSAAFQEIGKSGNGGVTSAYAQIEAKATDIMKRDNCTKAVAMDKAMDENPDLVAKYREELNK